MKRISFLRRPITIPLNDRILKLRSLTACSVEIHPPSRLRHSPDRGEEKGAEATSSLTSWAAALAIGAWGIQVVRYVSFQGL
jgi:hypothetical protein